MKVEDFLEKALRAVVDEHKYDLFYVSDKYITKVKSQYSDVEVNDLVYAKAQELLDEEASDNEFEEFWDYPNKEAEEMDMAGMKSLDFE